MKRFGKSSFILISVIIDLLMIANNLSAHNLPQGRSMLSPLLHIHSSAIRQGFIKARPKLPEISSPAISLEDRSLEELSQLLIRQCENNDFSSLKVNWDKKHLDYQQFIKETAAINTAINHFIYSEDVSDDMDFGLFLDKAIITRIEMIENHQSPLSDQGVKALNFIKASPPALAFLQELMDPPFGWFIPLFDEQRKNALAKECNPTLDNSGTYDPAPYTPKIVATWGCSSQCDHCDGGSVVEVTSFPWNWVNQMDEVTPRYITRITQEPNLNDYFRDYYDFVYDKDASDLLLLTRFKFVSTSGFAPGSVAERALKKILQSHHIKAFQISVAPSAWMRSTIVKGGAGRYISYLDNIKDIIREYNRSYSHQYGKLTFQFAVYDFLRIDDDVETFREIFDYCYTRNSSPVNITVWKNGNFNRLEQNGLVDHKNGKSPVSAFRTLSSDEDLKNFLASDVANTALFPDGQVSRVVVGSAERLNRSYRTIPGLEPIGKYEINCWFCNNVECPGNKAKKCIGKSNIFRYHGLSENGGFKNSFSGIESAI